jgi:hypothetical protein
LSAEVKILSAECITLSAEGITFSAEIKILLEEGKTF